jgi:chemotaxis protein histidine kinase CheA
MMTNLGPKIAMLDRQKELEEKFQNFSRRQEELQRVIMQMRYLSVMQILG